MYSNDLLSAYERHVYQALSNNADLATLVGTNPLTQKANVYFQVAEEGAGELYVTFDYSTESHNHDDIPGETIFADAEFQVLARGPRSRSAELRQMAGRIKAALHRTSSTTTDGSVLQCVEIAGLVIPPWEDDGVLQAGRGGRYNIWVQPPA